MDLLDETHRYRCGACGNLTRFDVFERRRTRRYHHYTVGGDLEIEEEEVLDADVERVVCRWCNSADAVEVVPIAVEKEAGVMIDRDTK